MTSEIDLHCFELRYQHTRVARPQALNKLISAIEKYGQQTPVDCVKEEKWVLIDGYLRFQAIKRLGRDTLQAQIKEGTAVEAVLSYLHQQQGYHSSSIEQAWLIQELSHLPLSQMEIAQRLGRDKSWVSRRLSLLSQLPETFQNAIRAGTLSAWAANRVFIPLARANTAHAQQLFLSLKEEPLSTRELNTWYQHYEKSHQSQREKLVEHPALFIQTLNTRAQDKTAQAPPHTPEEQWQHDIKKAGTLLQRLTSPLRTLMDSETQNVPQVMHFEQQVLKLQDRYQQFTKSFQEVLYAYRTTHRDHQTTACPRQFHQSNQPSVETVTQHRAQSAEENTQKPLCADSQVATHQLEIIRAVLSNEGQRGTDPTTASG